MWFQQLFAGNPRAYGIYSPTEVRADGKQKGVGKTINKPVTAQLYDDHLAGVRRLGIIPIRPDTDTVGWFAGDIDDYKIDLSKLEKKVQERGLPLVVIRSKSGGAHVFCFLTEQIPAETAITLMRGWMSDLGFKKVEIFPKQANLVEDGIGNWIHLPYFKSDDPDSWAVGINGERLSLDEFRQLATARSAGKADLEEWLKPKARGKGSEKFDGPPCIEQMFANGIPEGGRNSSLTHIGIYFLKSDEDNWRDKLASANYKYLDDPLGQEELNGIFRNIAKAKYEYMCNTEPMCSMCDKELCGTRKWGVGPQRGIDFASGDIDRIIKIASDPPIYYVILNGASVKMSTDQLMSPSKFRRRIFEITGQLITPMKERQHEARILDAKTDIEAAPEEVSEEGLIFEAFQEWCEVNIPNARELAQVLRGIPFYDKENKEIIFRGMDFVAAIKRQKKFNLADRDVWAAMRKAGARQANKYITKQTKVWTYVVEEPWFEIPGTEAF